MPRIRTIKPGFFQSDDVSALPLRARLTWIGLWTQCDDAGRTKDHPRLIKAAIWPLDNVSLADIEEDLNTLDSQGRIVRYEVDGQHYLEVVNWSEHQVINRPSRSKIPPSTAAAGNGTNPRPTAAKGEYVSTHGSLTETSLSTHSGKGKERKGKEGTRDARAREVQPRPDGPEPTNSEPPRTCQNHPNGTSDRCWNCAAARQANETWQAARRVRVDAAPKCPWHTGELAANCGPCRAERIAAEAS